VIVNRGLHQACKAEVVHHIYVEDTLGISTLLCRPVIKEHFNRLRVALSARDMQGVAAISIIEVDVNVFLEQQLNDIELVLPRGNQQ